MQLRLYFNEPSLYYMAKLRHFPKNKEKQYYKILIKFNCIIDI